MSKLLIIFFIGLAALMVGPYLIGQQGEIFVRVAGYEIYMTLSAFLLALMALMVVYWIISSLVKRVFRGSQKSMRWFTGRKANYSKTQTQLALVRFLEGDYQASEKALIKGAKHAEFPALNYLLAAEVAKKQGNLDASQHYLVLASSGEFDNELALDITQIRVLIEKGDFNTAIVRIERLRALKPTHPEVLNLSAHIYQGAKAYSALVQLLPQLTKYQIFPSAQLDTMKNEAYQGLMSRICLEEGVEALKNWWNTLSRHEKKDGVIQAIFIDTLLHDHDVQSAKIYYQTFIKQHMTSELLKLAGRFDSLDWRALNKRISKWENKVSDKEAIASAKALIIQKLDETQAK